MNEGRPAVQLAWPYSSRLATLPVKRILKMKSFLLYEQTVQLSKTLVFPGDCLHAQRAPDAAKEYAFAMVVFPA